MTVERRVGRFSCAEVLAHLPALVDGTLAPGDLADVRTHVAGCDVCERFGGEYAAVVTALRSAQRSPTPDPDTFADRLLDALDRR